MIITSKKIDHSIKWVNLTKMKNKMSYLEIIATAPKERYLSTTIWYQINSYLTLSNRFYLHYILFRQCKVHPTVSQ